MLRRIVVLVVALSMVMSIGGSSFAQSTYNWRLQSTYPVTSPFYKDVTTKLVQCIQENTGGRVKITMFPAGQLVPPGDVLDALGRGVFEMTAATGFYWGGILPEANIEFGLPMMWRDRYEMETAFWEKGLLNLFREAYAERRVHYLNVVPYGPLTINSRVPIKDLAQLRKMKVRVYGTYAKHMEKLGVKTVAIPYGEVYSALSSGVIDAAITGMAEYEDMRFNEVAPYMHFPPVGGIIGLHWLINKKTWDGLPDEVKRPIDQCGYSGASFAARFTKDLDDTVKSRLPKIGAHAVQLPDKDVAEMQEAANQIWDEVAKANPRSAKMVGIIREYLKTKGHLK
jgi:TRAP-type C4-dicarboxylate transport system substrate-binding protein